MTKFLECPRRFAYHYIDKIETTFEEGIGMLKGRAFHDAIDSGNFDKLDENLGNHEPEKRLVKAAVRMFREKKERGDFPVVTHTEQKIINEEECFLGYMDEVSIDDKSGLWMVGEMKTSAKFDPVAYAIAETKHQTALYKGMAKPFCSSKFLSVNDFAGLNYKAVIFPFIKPLKGRGKNAVAETLDAFEQRAYEKTMILHKIVPVRDNIVNDAMHTFRHTVAAIDHLGKNSDRYPKHCGSCNHIYFGLCEFIEVCMGIKVSLQDDISSDIDSSELPE
jgi:hypothetical protein